jgi:hypothetical protein
MGRDDRKHRIPGWIATGLLTLVASLWTLWSMAELYYEAWWAPWSGRLPYLVPGAVCLVFLLVALTWPLIGGWLIISVGGAFTVWWWGMAVASGRFSLEAALSMFPVSGMLVIIGVLFLFEHRYRRRRAALGWTPSKQWLRRNLRYVIAIGLPFLVGVAVSVFYLPILMTRLDDGERGARQITGNGVELIWAPEGPGWSRGLAPDQPFSNSQNSGNPNLSWNQLALYGIAPVGFEVKPQVSDRDARGEDMVAYGLCRYLSADGVRLMAEPQDIWRMPTVDEIVRSLVRHGENAGCEWDGVSSSATCEILPDKETPLWAPNWSPIYYWAADEFDEHEAYYVAYNGNGIAYQPKSWGNPRHGHRCVREP